MKAKTQSTKKQPAKLPKKAPRKFQPQARLTKGSPSSVSPKARPDAPTTNARPHISKKATIESLVRREQGAAITELMTVTGWQEHSVRAALTGLRKAGHAITRERVNSETRYLIAGAG